MAATTPTGSCLVQATKFGKRAPDTASRHCPPVRDGEAGNLLVVCCSTNDPETGRHLLASLAERRADGIAHVPCSPEGSAAVRALNPRLPVVEYARRSLPDAIDLVTGDEERGTRQSTAASRPAGLAAAR